MPFHERIFVVVFVAFETERAVTIFAEECCFSRATFVLTRRLSIFAACGAEDDTVQRQAFHNIIARQGEQDGALVHGKGHATAGTLQLIRARVGQVLQTAQTEGVPTWQHT